MLYVARELCLPTGERLRGYVVDVVGGCVVSIRPFDKEFPSMCLFDEIVLSYSPDGLHCGEIQDTVRAGVSGHTLYAYSRNGNGVTRL